MPNHLNVDLRSTMLPKRRRRLEAIVTKARSRDSLQAFAKLVRVEEDGPVIVADPPLIVPVEDLFDDDVAQVYDRMGELLASYRASLNPDRQRLFDQSRFLRMARKVVGVGSVGTRAWILLIEGWDPATRRFCRQRKRRPPCERRRRSNQDRELCG